jgi:hypothetical protein
MDAEVIDKRLQVLIGFSWLGIETVTGSYE